MKKLNEELEEVLDKHIKDRPKISNEVYEIVHNCAIQLRGAEPALAIALIALGHALKHAEIICNETNNEIYFTQILSDPIIKMISIYSNQILSCKRFK